MRLLFELSGEHPSLPAAEALATLELQGGAREELREETLLVVETPARDMPALAGRLALTHCIDEALSRVPAERDVILDAVKVLEPRVGPAFRVRVHRVGAHGRALSPHALERDAGALLAPGREVRFEGPADEVRVLLARQAHLGLRLAEVDRAPFDARHVRHRPFFSPVSLHPRFARALVNLARVRPGDKVADPFAGTGGILVEAGLVGARVVGADLDPAMAQGTREVLAHYGIPGEVLEGDVAETLARLGPVDAVVSDPPYGRASTTAKEPPPSLHRRALDAMAGALRPGGRLAVVLPGAEAARAAPPGLRLEQEHVQRVHRSLDRHYFVFRRA